MKLRVQEDQVGVEALGQGFGPNETRLRGFVCAHSVSVDGLMRNQGKVVHPLVRLWAGPGG